jgi:alpha-methylacyl-CoA racemase
VNPPGRRRDESRQAPPEGPAASAEARSEPSAETGEAGGALQGVRVIELASIGPGPFAAMLLADHGAEVLRIERPGPEGRDDVRHDPVTTRGRARRLVLDLKSAAGREALLREIEDADILLEGFRPGVMERLGLGPADCHARNPRLVYGRMTGWGQQGPLAARAGHDINYIALAGVLHAIGPGGPEGPGGAPGGKPVPPLNLIGDFGGGALYLAFGVLAALLRARASGRGQVVDAAMVDGALSLMAMTFGRIAAGHWRDGERAANSLDGGRPWYDTYATADGRHVAVGANEPQFYRLLCEGLGLTPQEAALRDDAAAWPALRACIAARFATRTRDQWAARFEGTDACVSPVLTLAEAEDHAHNRARGNVQRIDGIAQPAVAPRISPAAPAEQDEPSGSP